MLIRLRGSDAIIRSGEGPVNIPQRRLPRRVRSPDVARDDRGVDRLCHAGNGQIVHQRVDPVALNVGVRPQFSLELASEVRVFRREGEDPHPAEIDEPFLYY